ncbi:MAG: Txe/YoeB family addiction module toxin, partial [Dehalococcoidia bacterium]
MRLCFTPAAWEDYLWCQQHDRALLKRINLLIQDTLRSSFDGIGKPEPLKANLNGYWSRRINDEHRLVYQATATELVIIACRYHYAQ